jgi:hypothetical protein
MAAAGLTVSYFDPIVSKKKPYFFPPRRIASKICEERSGTGLTHNK